MRVTIANAALIFSIVFVTLLAIAECQPQGQTVLGLGQPRLRIPGRPGRPGRPGFQDRWMQRCPDGGFGFQTCSGFRRRPRDQCPFGFYCHAPADAGVCCRERRGWGGGGGAGTFGQCPPPRRLRRMCPRDGLFDRGFGGRRDVGRGFGGRRDVGRGFGGRRGMCGGRRCTSDMDCPLRRQCCFDGFSRRCFPLTFF